MDKTKILQVIHDKLTLNGIKYWSYSDDVMNIITCRGSVPWKSDCNSLYLFISKKDYSDVLNILQKIDGLLLNVNNNKILLNVKNDPSIIGSFSIEKKPSNEDCSECSDCLHHCKKITNKKIVYNSIPLINTIDNDTDIDNETSISILSPQPETNEERINNNGEIEIYNGDVWIKKFGIEHKRLLKRQNIF